MDSDMAYSRTLTRRRDENERRKNTAPYYRLTHRGKSISERRRRKTTTAIHPTPYPHPSPPPSPWQWHPPHRHTRTDPHGPRRKFSEDWQHRKKALGLPAGEKRGGRWETEKSWDGRPAKIARGGNLRFPSFFILFQTPRTLVMGTL